MGFNRFSILIAVRIILIILTLVAFVTMLLQTGYPAGSLVILGLLIYQVISIFKFVSKTNQDQSRFLDAAKYADYSQRFQQQGVGAGFEELGKVFTEILQRFHSIRSNQEEELKYLKAMVEHIPVPLLSLHADQTVTLLNNGARRLFGNHQVNKLADIEVLSGDLIDHLAKISPGEQRLVHLEIDGMTQQLTISTTTITIGNKQEKLISLQDIKNELEGVQLQAWQDLVRVLTHEIMNSITPVASLAKTANDLITDLKQKVNHNPEISEELDDVENAIATVSRRSDGLMNFVSSYRQLTRLPKPNKQTIKVQEILHNVQAVAAHDWHQNGVSLTISINPSEVEISVDKDMIEQVLINILKNAEQAVIQSPEPAVKISASLNRRGHVMITIEDNGAGIEEEVASKIFVPFYTTKREGSGVGLALSRQIMIAHGGNIKLDRDFDQGARFILTF